MPCAQRNPCVFICYTVISTAISKKNPKQIKRSIRRDQQFRKTLQIGHHIQANGLKPMSKDATKPTNWESLESKVPWWRLEETRAELCDGS